MDFPTVAAMSNRTILGAAVRAIREARAVADPGKFAGSRVAIAAGMSHAYLCNIEKGRKYPPEPVIARIADALGVEVDAISYLTDTATEVAS